MKTNILICAALLLAALSVSSPAPAQEQGATAENPEQSSVLAPPQDDETAAGDEAASEPEVGKTETLQVTPGDDKDTEGEEE